MLCVCVPAFIDDPSILLVNMEELEEAEKLRSLGLSLIYEDFTVQKINFRVD